MRFNGQAGAAGRRERREFSAEFKAEAVRLVAERRAAGVSLAQVGRELDVQPDQLRAWARQLRRGRIGDAGGIARAGESPAAARGGGAAPGAGVRKKSGGVLREGVALRYAVITRHRGEFQVRLMCRVLEVSPAGYYASLKRPPSWHALIDEVLMARVRIIHTDSGQTYGAPRVQRELQAEGLPASTKRVARLMREDDLVARPRKRHRVSTTDSTHGDPIAPNLLARQFDVNGVGLNRVWVADITYLPTREAHLYLATVLDLASRRCVGWAIRDTLEVERDLIHRGVFTSTQNLARRIMTYIRRYNEDPRPIKWKYNDPRQRIHVA